jgi:quinolinate synthase
MQSQLNFTEEVKNNTSDIYERIKSFVPDVEWPFVAPYIYEINKLKKETNSVILAHNYQTPQIFYGVADIVGDSLALAIKAAEVKEENIIMCGVHFMAETAKIMSPEKKVYLPDMRAGCSLAASITGEDIRKLKKQHPGVPVVTYVNTTADVKAETDICCTSANAVKVVESLGVKKVIFLPDEYLAKYVASKTDVEIISWHGKCEVHEKFSEKEIHELRKNYPDLTIIAHPECPPDVINASDFAGSTSHMVNYVKEKKPKNVFLVTECSMSDNVEIENPDVNFVKPCNLCPHMKSIEFQKF